MSNCVSKFMTDFIDFINKQNIISIYFDDAAKDAVYPYGVIDYPNETFLRYGTQVFFEIYIWADNSIKTENLESKVQKIKEVCDGKIFTESHAILYCDGIKKVDDQDYTKIKKQISFVARIM